MWREEKDPAVVTIRIIDWDCAHCQDEQGFCRKVFKKVCDFEEIRGTEFSTQLDWRFFEVLQTEVSEENTTWWTDLASNNKTTVDRAFSHLCD
jgi:hypothetical protein